MVQVKDMEGGGLGLFESSNPAVGFRDWKENTLGSSHVSRAEIWTAYLL